MPSIVKLVVGRGQNEDGEVCWAAEISYCRDAASLFPRGLPVGIEFLLEARVKGLPGVFTDFSMTPRLM